MNPTSRVPVMMTLLCLLVASCADSTEDVKAPIKARGKPLQVSQGASDPITFFGLTQPISGLANDHQERPAVGTDGSDYLVSWRDGRKIAGERSGVWGVRMSGAGAVLDPGGFEIFEDLIAILVPPAISFDGTNYFVVAAQKDGIIRGKKVTPGGQVLDAGQGTELGEIIYEQRPRLIDVVFGTSSHLVVWTDGGTGASVFGRLVDISGAPVGPRLTLNLGGHANGPRVAFADGVFLVVWREHSVRQLMAIRIDETGQVLDPAPIVLDIHANEHSVGTDGALFMIAWFRDGDPRKVVFRRLGPDGSMLDPAPVPLSTQLGSAVNPVNPSVDFDGQNFLIAWNGYNPSEMLANRVSPGGVVLDGTGFSLLGPSAGNISRYSSTACSGASCLVTWQEYPSARPPDIFGIRVQNGAPVDPEPIHLSAAAVEQGHPGVAFGGGQHLVVWEEVRAGVELDIFGARVMPDGTVLDPSGFKVSSAPNDQELPRVASSSTGYLVIWVDRRPQFTGFVSERNIFATRVTFGGDVLDPDGIQLTTSRDISNPVVASDGSDFLAVWHRWNLPLFHDEVRAARIDGTTGALLQDDPLVLTPGGGATSPAIAYGGGQYLVAWMHGADIRAIRIDSSGVPIDPLPGFIVAAGDYPSVAFDGQHFVIVYRRLESDGLYRMYGTRVSGSGVVIDPSGIQLSPQGLAGPISGAWLAGPEVSFDGEDSFVVWPSTVPSTGIDGVWMRPNGSVIGERTLATAAPNRILAPALSGQGDARSTLVLHSYGDTSPGIKTFRLRAAMATFEPNGQNCVDDDECKSGFCVDGVCCDSRCGYGDPSDCQACSVLAGAIRDGECGPIAEGAVCRQATGSCDVAEACDGTSLSCPPDELVDAGEVCRGVEGTCDAEEVCTGSSAQCPDDEVLGAGTECRPEAGPCDVAESCDGESKACPDDAYEPPGALCRGAAGGCDRAEVCSGDSVECPIDEFLGGNVLCRAAEGACDVAEFCTGVQADCPADLVAPSGMICRSAAGPCDIEEQCNGVEPACPKDRYVEAGTVCRDAAGECDVAEHCTGVDAACPEDRLVEAGTVCREVAGECDVAEHCTEVDAFCPEDRFVEAGTVCREAVRECDVAESCKGDAPDCPQDELAEDGTPCDDGDLCTEQDVCRSGTCSGEFICDEGAGGAAGEGGGVGAGGSEEEGNTGGKGGSEGTSGAGGGGGSGGGGGLEIDAPVSIEVGRSGCGCSSGADRTSHSLSQVLAFLFMVMLRSRR